MFAGKRFSAAFLWKYIKALVKFPALAAVVLSIMSFMPNSVQAFELASHFRLQYAIAQVFFLCLATLIMLKRKDPALAVNDHSDRIWNLNFSRQEIISVLICFLLNAFFVASVYLPLPARQASNRHLKLIQINVNTANKKYDEVANLIQEVSPDIVAAQELDENWCKELSSRLPEYKNRICFPRPDNFGIALFSKLAWKEAHIAQIGKAGLPSAQASIDFDGAIITVLSTHTLPPVQSLAFEFRNEQLEALASQCRSRQGSKVLLGDLNLTPYSSYFGKLLQESCLQDSRQGFGVQGSWPTMFWLKPMLIPIDHCLVSPDLTVIERKILKDVGSDHLPVYIKLARSRS